MRSVVQGTQKRAVELKKIVFFQEKHITTEPKIDHQNECIVIRVIWVERFQWADMVIIS